MVLAQGVSGHLSGCQGVSRLNSGYDALVSTASPDASPRFPGEAVNEAVNRPQAFLRRWAEGQGAHIAPSSAETKASAAREPIGTMMGEQEP